MMHRMVRQRRFFSGEKEVIYITAENTVAVRSVTEAIIVARQAIRDHQVIPISPCVQVDSAGAVMRICPKLDQTGRTLCKDPDGPLPTNGRLECPLQYGQLTKRVNGADQESAQSRL